MNMPECRPKAMVSFRMEFMVSSSEYLPVLVPRQWRALSARSMAKYCASDTLLPYAAVARRANFLSRVLKSVHQANSLTSVSHSRA